GHSMKLHQSAADPVRSPVDHLMADFEDACPYEFKGEKSRKVMVEALNTLDFGKKVVTIRPNNIHSSFFKGDLEAVILGAPNRFHGLILPKTRGPEEIAEVSKLLDDLEKRGGWKYKLQIESLIETAHGRPDFRHRRFRGQPRDPRDRRGPEPQLPLLQAGGGDRGQSRRAARNRQRVPAPDAQGRPARAHRRD